MNDINLKMKQKKKQFKENQKITLNGHYVMDMAIVSMKRMFVTHRKWKRVENRRKRKRGEDVEQLKPKDVWDILKVCKLARK